MYWFAAAHQTVAPKLPIIFLNFFFTKNTFSKLFGFSALVSNPHIVSSAPAEILIPAQVPSFVLSPLAPDLDYRSGS